MEIIERYTNPSKHVQAQFGTVCKNGENYFVQVSRLEESPKWINMGKLLTFCLKDQFNSENYIFDIITIYENKIAKPGASLFNLVDFDSEGD